MKAIIFDFDGTLIDTTGSIWGEYQRVSNLMGLPKITFRQFTNQLGKPWVDVLLTLWPDVDIDEFNRLYRKGTERGIPIKGIRGTLRELNKDYRLALLTSRGEKSLFQHLNAAGFDPSLFELILDRDSTKNHKPDPQALMQACKELKLKPEDVMYVGDSLVDMECALRANIEFVGVLTGGTTREEFEKGGTEHILTSIVELLNLIK